MVANMNTILIIGGTSGLGEGFARRFHGLGKKVIVTGRRQDRLSALAKELPGLETYQWDISDIPTTSNKASEILTKYADIDTIIMMAGIQYSFNYGDPSTSSDESVISEINTNLTAPALLSRTFFPFLAKRAAEGKFAALIPVTSGLAYIPFGFYPIYCSTKAAVHALSIVLRQQIQHAPEAVKKNFSICELSPPYVDTPLDVQHRERINAILGDKMHKPMPLEEYLDLAMAGLDKKGGDGKLLKEVTVPGFSELGATTWRNGFDKIYESMGIEC